MAVAQTRKNRALDLTQSFFTAGDLMEVAGDFGDADAGRYEEVRSRRASRWLALATASALALLAIILVTT